MEPHDILESIENSPDSFMIIGPEKGKILTDLIKKYQPKNVLEIGTNLGYSTILMGTVLPTNCKITTLELQPKSAEKAQGNINKAGFQDKIKIIIGDAKQTIQTLDDTFDFVFIDAAKKQYLFYLELVESKLSAEAIIVADNVGRFKEEVKPYLDYVKNKYESKTIEVGDDAVEVSILS
jgi:predicted O-methyltransferase YrrM